jgi:hypothetical protein
MKKKNYSLPDVDDYVGITVQKVLLENYLDGLLNGGNVFSASLAFDMALIELSSSVKIPEDESLEFMDKAYSSGLFDFICSRISNIQEVRDMVESVGRDAVKASNGFDGVLGKIQKFMEDNKGNLSEMISEFSALKEELKDSPISELIKEAK